MDAAFALLLPLVGGYLYIRGCNGLRYKAAREDGHRLYFRVAYHGIFLFVASLAVLGVAYWLLHGYPWFVQIEAFLAGTLGPLLKEPNQANGQLAFLLVCLFSVALGRLAPIAINAIFKHTTQEQLWAAAAENELEEFLLEALGEAKSISVTLTKEVAPLV